MFDSVSANNLREAPELPNLDPKLLPSMLTKHYAQSTSIEFNEDHIEDCDDTWSLPQLADAYEFLSVTHPDENSRKKSAFVAAMSHQILAQKEDLQFKSNISSESLDLNISSALLFLAAEQYADAAEASKLIKIKRENQSPAVNLICEHIINICSGKLSLVIDRSSSYKKNTATNLEDRAKNIMLQNLIEGLCTFANETLNSNDYNDSLTNFMPYFDKVEKLSGSFKGVARTSFAGINHLASLLRLATSTIIRASLMKIEIPGGVNTDFWLKWLNHRATEFPYVWTNHKEAISKGFINKGVSAVIVLPTGAGKTTISCLKIANVLSYDKKVIFIAPTHALVEQLKDDLAEIFPDDILGSKIPNDSLPINKVDLNRVEVMTPEKCLATLSFADSEDLKDVGLLVFDECHMISPESGSFRRSLDSMLAILAFNKISPNADMLFLSAMISNGKEFADWIQDLTDRQCISIDLLWKPSRQVRGLVVYSKEEVDKCERDASLEQSQLNASKNKQAKGLRKTAKEKLRSIPYAAWALDNNWLEDNQENQIKLYKLLPKPVLLGWSEDLKSVTPNSNELAKNLAAEALKNNLKTIIFVNTKQHAINIANDLSRWEKIQLTDLEKKLQSALEAELGGLKHSLLPIPFGIAVPHNSRMLKIERNISERLFKRDGGAKVIVATPTLAQGLNLPAKLAILAGDKRSSIAKKREILKTHEVLNAIARAGRAGYLSNGIVLLIPEPVLTFSNVNKPDSTIWDRLKQISPENDKCLNIEDPLFNILNLISSDQGYDEDLVYILNKFAMKELNSEKSNKEDLFDLSKSFSAFRAKRRGEEDAFNNKVNCFMDVLKVRSNSNFDESVIMLSSKSGFSREVLNELKNELENNLTTLPNTIENWIKWLFQLFINHEVIFNELISPYFKDIRDMLGLKEKDEFNKKMLLNIEQALIGWVNGKPLSEIEQKITCRGNVEEDCRKARVLVTSFINTRLTFIFSILACFCDNLNFYEQRIDLRKEVLDNLSLAVARGFNSPEMLLFADANRNIITRVFVHREFAKIS